MILNNNILSMNIYASYSNALQQETQAMTQISSGVKINNAQDNPYGLTQSEQMTMQIRGMQMASKNTQDGVSMLQTAEGGLNNMTAMLQRIRQLVVESGNGANSTQDNKDIQDEIDKLVDSMDNAAQSTNFNGKQLLAQDGSVTAQIGANTGESITIPEHNLTSSNLGINIGTSNAESIQQLKSNGPYSIINGSNVGSALNIIDGALNTISSVNGQYGALENRFQESNDALNNISIQVQGAESGLTDTDIASAMMEYSKDNILTEAGNAMMVQNNKLPQEILQILANVK
jgi:flagellin